MAARRRLAAAPALPHGVAGPSRTLAYEAWAVMGSARPARRFDALRDRSSHAIPPAEAVGRPSMDFRSPSGNCHRDPAPSVPVARRADDAGSPGLCLPFDTLSAGRTRCRRRIPPPTRAMSGVWLPPSRRPPPGLPARYVPERPWASPFKAFPSTAIGTPLGARALLAFPASPPPPSRGSAASKDPAVFRALFPRRVRSATRVPKGPGRRCLPGVHPSRASTRPSRRTH